MLIGEPTRISSGPTFAAKASGISIRDGVIPMRWQTLTALGTNAAVAPVAVMTVPINAATVIVRTNARLLLLPALESMIPDTHAVTPVASSASATINNEAMRITVGLENPEII
ncbi:hypothetical protein NIIDMKKI_14020 [Mycobacterium kansasii]|uniref:Uncharacterized protein n=1 Tax=Mycobacterium kansasii TaxID=1768 RepID=A0A7G1I5C4_MYCKA|nr:hypothetical protein NIIDMKKI_14020 [Mycobacterium kansasii]